VLGLTWLVAFVNLMLVIIVRRIVGELGVDFLKRIRWEFSISVTVVVLVFSYGVRTLIARGSGGLATAWIAAIQPNIPQTEKFDPGFEDQAFAQLERLTRMASATRHDLIVWPEAATPRGIFADEINWEFIRRIAANVSVPILIGTVEDYVDREQAQAFNTAVLLTPGSIDTPPRIQKYRKMHLVPFGEYLPLRPLLGGIIGGLVPGDISAGSDVVVIDSPVGKLGPLICFEDTLGDLTRRFVLRGSQLLVNITNDGWFLRTAGSEVHLANAVFRAVENRRPLLRCTNTGVTCLVTPEGRVDRRIEPHRQGFTVHPVSIREQTLTFYTRRGDWIVWVSSAAILLAILRRWRARPSSPLPAS
jgi:apolipoprotein N-acyltransferase